MDTAVANAAAAGGTGRQVPRLRADAQTGTPDAAEHGLRLTRFHVATPPVAGAGGAWRAVFCTRTAQLRIVGDAAWSHVVADDLGRLTAAERDGLVEAGLLVPAGSDELAEVLRDNITAAESTEMLSLVVMPTASCQLGCGYCGQLHTQRWLSEHHQDQFLRMAAARLDRSAYRQLFIRWFGAEPLSGIGVIRRFSPRLQALAAEHGCTYGARVVTNGLALTESLAAELVDTHRVRIIDITLDGVAEYHDRRRMEKNGKPTYDRIFRNLVSLARSDLDVTINVRCNVDASNHGGVIPLLRALAAAGIQRRINFYVAPIHDWGGNGAERASLSPEEFATEEIEWLCEMIALGFAPGVLPTRKPVVCMAVEPHSLLVDAVGGLFNCTEVPYVPTYGGTNRYRIGDVTVGEKPDARRELGSFNERVARHEYPCSSCRMLPVCGGACPKAWNDGHPPCPSTLHNIEARLLLAVTAVASPNRPS
ncbi:radical SAM protein [Nocardia sp. BMG51109]|uniref:radical SAM/SPASM domain-containing protein n=1 Tax=Nocardia sp. BMG51109 TaxID=1056816 RepID=UPI0004BB2D88|nr:radical SAM protein [Nocardia sp. BMG51109]